VGVLPLGDPAEARDVFLAVRAALARAHSYSLFGAGIMLGLGALAYLVVGVVIGRLVPPSALLGGSGGGQTVLFLLTLVGFVAALRTESCRGTLKTLCHSAICTMTRSNKR